MAWQFEELKANYHNQDKAYEILCRAAGVDPALDAGWAKARSEEEEDGDPAEDFPPAETDPEV